MKKRTGKWWRGQGECSAWQETIAEWLFLWTVDFVRAEEQILVMCLIEEILRQLESSFSINRVLD